MTGREEFYSSVKLGKQGGNLGLNVGSYKLKKLTGGYLQTTNYLIGGASGTGKTTYMLWSYIYCPLIDFLKGNMPEKDPYWIFFSLEMPRIQIYAKLISMFIYDNFREEVRYMEIFSMEEGSVITEEHEKILYDPKCIKFLEELDKRITFYGGKLNSKKYIEKMEEAKERFGRVDPITKEYIPNNPKQIVGVVIDHMSLIQETNGRSKKSEIDLISSQSVEYKNETKIFSNIHVAQFNRSSHNEERMKQAMQDPNISDFKDSGSIYEDSNVVIAVYAPHKNGLTIHYKYNISLLKDRYIATFLLKSRFGNDAKLLPMAFYGDCSHYIDLPLADKMGDYRIYEKIGWQIAENHESLKIEEEPQKQKFEFKF